MRIVAIPSLHPDRHVVEARIADVYLHSYGAQIRTFAPLLVASFDNVGLVAAAGLRFGRAPYFSEAYLDQPIESALSTKVGAHLLRERIVEISSLAAVRAGTALPFLHDVIDLCRAARFEWAFFTATAPLRRLLTRAGISVIDLAPARRERIPDPTAWGTYYDHDPRVVAVHHKQNIARRDGPARHIHDAHA
jgi:hypothetical protein